MEENGTRCFMHKGTSSVYRCTITIITSASYPENFLEFRVYVFALTTLTISVKGVIGL